MPGLISTLYSSYSGMSVSQMNIQTTSHNINNMNTPGYTRQQVVQTQRSAYSYPGYNSYMGAGQIGQGVQADDVVRIRNSFHDFQFRNETHEYGATAKKYENFRHMETIFNEPSDSSISSAYNDFYMSWHELSKRPGDAGSIDVVIQNTKFLSQNISNVTDKLSSMKEQINTDLEENLKSINSSIEKLRGLQKDIKLVEGSGKTPNDLYDEVDRIIDDLSYKMNMNTDETRELLDSAIQPGNELRYSKDANGDITGIYVTRQDGSIVTTDGNVLDHRINKNGEFVTIDKTTGKDMVVKDLSKAKVSELLDEDGKVYAKVDDMGNIKNDKGQNIGYVDKTTGEAVMQNGETYTTKASGMPTSDISGEIQGCIEMNKKIDEYVSNMQTMAQNLADNINRIVNLNNNPNGNIIEFDTNGNPMLSVVEDAHNILEAIPHDEMVNIAGQMYDLKDEKVIPVTDNNGNPVLDANGNPKMVSINTYYNDLVQKLGNETSEVIRAEANQSKVLNGIESSRMSITGVSLDEEMVNLIQFQHSYSASAKVISTLDSLLDVVINGLKR